MTKKAKVIIIANFAIDFSILAYGVLCYFLIVPAQFHPEKSPFGLSDNLIWQIQGLGALCFSVFSFLLTIRKLFLFEESGEFSFHSKEMEK